MYMGDSYISLVVEYPEHPWKMWKFPKSPRNFWQTLGNTFTFGSPIAETIAREFLSELEAELNITKPSDWTNQKISEISPTNAKRLASFGGIQIVLSRFYPDLEIELDKTQEELYAKLTKSRFEMKEPPGIWNSRKDRVKFLDVIKEQLGGEYHHMYNISRMMFYVTGSSFRAKWVSSESNHLI